MDSSSFALTRACGASRESPSPGKRKTLTAGTTDAPDDNVVTDSFDVPDIKSGEAYSLVSPFSCLRPAIDGVEGLFRMGLAWSAYALSIQQGIALNCLMACYNLATLYRDGFRYRKYMWNVEMLSYMAIYQARYQASCTPRPRLSGARAPVSLFHPSSVLLLCAQAIIHLTTLTLGVRMGNGARMGNALEEMAAGKVSKKLIRWKARPKLASGSTRRPSLNTIAETIIESAQQHGMDRVREDDNDRDFFGRPKLSSIRTTQRISCFSFPYLRIPYRQL